LREYIILAQNDVTARAMLRIFRSMEQSHSLEKENENIHTIIVDTEGMEADQLFETITGKLENLEGDNPARYPLEGRFILVDHIRPQYLNPLSGPAWEAAIAMLVLAFPEIYWIFGEIYGSDLTEFNSSTCMWETGKEKEDEKAVTRHCLANLFAVFHDPLFDGTGLRNFILKKISETTDDGRKKKIAPYVPTRTELAVAMDEETSYAYFNAYASYRFGFRALAVRRNRQALELFGNEKYKLKNFKLSLEDIFLSFPDQTGREQYSNLSLRDESLKGLRQAKFRVFVTSEHRHSGDSEKHANNHTHIGNIKAKLVRKPFSGLFSLWEEAKLAQKLSWKNRRDGKKYRGIGEGFIWPPAKNTYINWDDTGHSAPGRLLLVAEFLVNRAEHLLNERVFDVPTCVWGAVMVSTAQEILGDRTPTVSITALSLKHHFEVLAECQFSGVEYHIRIKPRISDIQNELKAAGHWFSGEYRKQAVENSEMMILNHFIPVLREYNQYDEECDCMNRVRSLHNNLWMRHRPWRYVFWPFLRYGEFLLSSFKGFLAAIVGWVVVMTVLFEIAKGIIPGVDQNSGSFHDVVSFFTGANTIPDSHWVLVGLIVLTIMAGLAHLGIFISHLYSIVSRK